MSTRPLTERVAKIKERRERTKKKLEQYDEQVKRLEKQAAEEERKQRTHNLIVCGAELASLFGKVLNRDEALSVVNFLREQLQLGTFMLPISKNEESEPVLESEQATKQENDDWCNGMFNF